MHGEDIQGRAARRGRGYSIQSMDAGLQGQRASAPVRKVVCSCREGGGEGQEVSPQRQEMVGLVFQAVGRTALWQ